MLRLILLSCSLLFGLTSQVEAASFDHSTLDQLLRKHVVVIRDGQATQVDYAGMAADRKILKQYLGQTSSPTRADFDRWSRAEQLAFLLNAYNAWTVELVLTGYPKIESIKDLGSLLQSPWKKTFIPLLGETRSLDDIEHGLIRGSGRYNDPRIHFAANCASIGCPALRHEAYQGSRLDAQLEDQTNKFFADRSRNHLQGGTLKVSSIFKWYRGDFEKGWQGIRRLPDFLARYAQPLGLSAADTQRLQSGKVVIDYLNYDWRLNATQSK